MRPSGARRAFQLVNMGSTSPGSCPRSLEAHRLTRLGSDPVLVPGDLPGDGEHDLAVRRPRAGRCSPSAGRDSCASPATVRRKSLPLKSSAASTIACSGSERRRRIGSSTTGSATGLRGSKNAARGPSRRRRRGSDTTGVVGLPSFSQPCSRAVSWQSGHTSRIVVAVRRVADRSLADEQRPLADRAGARGQNRLPRDPHGTGP